MLTRYNRKVIWEIVNSGFHSGSYNMQFDLELISKCSNQQAYFRIYRWQPYCISLGKHQSTEILNLNKLEQDGYEWVVRPTGGSAILHSEEITYSVVAPLNKNFTPQVWYDEIHKALFNGLILYDDRLIAASQENIQPNYNKVYQIITGQACFANTAKYEITIGGKKLIGSAQRKIGNFILQHGSILCGSHHKKIVDYLNLSINEKEEISNSLEIKTIDLQSYLGTSIDYEKLTACLSGAFENYFVNKELKIELN